LSGKRCPSPCTIVPLNPQLLAKDQEIIQPRTLGSILQSGLMDVLIRMNIKKREKKKWDVECLKNENEYLNLVENVHSFGCVIF
jgi:hypothetical protein